MQRILSLPDKISEELIKPLGKINVSLFCKEYTIIDNTNCGVLCFLS